MAPGSPESAASPRPSDADHSPQPGAPFASATPPTPQPSPLAGWPQTADRDPGRPSAWVAPALRYLLGLALASAAGGYAGWQAGLRAASLAPNPPQLAVLDTQEVIATALRRGGDPKAAADAVTAEVKARTRALAAQGVIVIDRTAVIDAPDDAYVELGVVAHGR